MSTTIVKPKPDATVELTPRQERKIYNRTKYRLNKRRNLWIRSIAAAKNPDKVKLLQAKIEALDFALATLDEA